MKPPFAAKAVAGAVSDVVHTDVELERAKLAFLVARTPYARRKALRRLEDLHALAQAKLPERAA